MRVRSLAATLGFFVAVSCAAAATSPPSVRLLDGPRSVTLGQIWTGTLKTTGDAPLVAARHGSSVVKARAASVGSGRHRVRLRLHVLGAWSVTATLAGKRFTLGTVTVRPVPPYALDSPAQLLVRDDGTLLVTERGTHDRILHVDPATGRFEVFATGVPNPFGLAAVGDGTLLVSSTTGLYRLAPGARPVRIADFGVSPFAILPSGEIAFAYESSVGILPPGGGRPRVLQTRVDFAHGIVLLPDGELAVSDTGNDRLLRIDLDRGTSMVIASGLKAPMGIALEPSGSLDVIEFEERRIIRVDTDGSQRTVAVGFQTPYALARAADGTIYVTEAGQVFQASGSLRRVAPDGAVTTIRLRR
jgi:streptogramin lyase